MKRFLLTTRILLFTLILACAGWYYAKMRPGKPHRTVTESPNSKIKARLHLRAQSLHSYAQKHGYNTNTCFLIDMSLNSGSNRLFVYDLKKDAVLDAGLVTKGTCESGRRSGTKYGNEPGCGCTSLGKYKIGKPYKGKFGLAYKLYGLDSTNSNAFKRFVVLHSHTCVPDGEVAPLPICRSEGCPTVSAAFLKKLAALIDGSRQPILLYTFDGN